MIGWKLLEVSGVLQHRKVNLRHHKLLQALEMVDECFVDGRLKSTETDDEDKSMFGIIGDFVEELFG